MDGLRDIDCQPFFGNALLVRALLYLAVGERARAEEGLAETLRIARAGPLKLLEMDYHLGAALLNATADRHEGCRHLATARQMMDEYRYDRRRRQLAELARQLEMG